MDWLDYLILGYIIGVPCGLFAALALVKMSRCLNCCQFEDEENSALDFSVEK